MLIHMILVVSKKLHESWYYIAYKKSSQNFNRHDNLKMITPAEWRQIWLWVNRFIYYDNNPSQLSIIFFNKLQIIKTYQVTSITWWHFCRKALAFSQPALSSNRYELTTKFHELHFYNWWKQHVGFSVAKSKLTSPQVKKAFEPNVGSHVPINFNT